MRFAEDAGCFCYNSRTAFLLCYACCGCRSACLKLSYDRATGELHCSASSNMLDGLRVRWWDGGMSYAEFLQVVRYVILCSGAAIIAMHCRKASLAKVAVKPTLIEGWTDVMIVVGVALVFGTLGPIPYGIGIWFFPSLGVDWQWNFVWPKVLSVAVAWSTAGWIGWGIGCSEWPSQRDQQLTLQELHRELAEMNASASSKEDVRAHSDK